MDQDTTAQGCASSIDEGAGDTLPPHVREEMHRRQEAQAQRVARGHYFIHEAAEEIARQQGASIEWSLTFEAQMRAAALANEKALTVRDPLTWLPVRPIDRVRAWHIVTRDDVNAWLDGQRAGYRWEERISKARQTAKPVQRQPAQDAAILEELRRLGLDPLALPAVQEGKASPEKAAVRAALPSLTKAVFDHAWKRLTGDKRIRYR